MLKTQLVAALLFQASFSLLSGQQVTTSGTCSSSGPQKIAVLIVNLPGSTVSPSITPAFLRTMLFGDSTTPGHSLDGYLREASYGKASATGDIYGPFTLTTNFTSSQALDLFTAAVNSVSASVPFQNYSHLMLILPSGFGRAVLSGCGTSIGNFVGGASWIGSDYLTTNDAGVCAAANAVGSHLGLGSADANLYPRVMLGAPGTTPTTYFGGDRFSTMGECFTQNGVTLLGHYAAPHKVALGWLDGAHVQTVTSTGTYTVQPYEMATNGVQALRIQRGTGGSQWLWVEFRQPVGYDATLGNPPNVGYSPRISTGAFVHFEDPADLQSAGHTRMLTYAALPYCPNPGVCGITDPEIPAGSTWIDPSSNLAIGVTSASPAGLTVSVTYASGPPVLTTSLSHGAFYPGQTSPAPAYSISVSNAFGAGATSSPVTVTLTLPPGLTISRMSPPPASPWSCTGATCTLSDALSGGRYETILAFVNIGGDAAPVVTTRVDVTGGGSGPASASDQTTIGQPPFFNGEAALTSPWYYLRFPNGTLFGYFCHFGGLRIYHQDLGWEYLFPANDADNGMYFTDAATLHKFYTNPKVFPFLYDFTFQAWLYYFPDPNRPDRYTSNPRSFWNMATNQPVTM